MKQFIGGTVKIYVGLLTISGEVLNKLKSKGFLASSLSTYNFSTLLHNLIQYLTELVEGLVNRPSYSIIMEFV